MAVQQDAAREPHRKWDSQSFSAVDVLHAHSILLRRVASELELVASREGTAAVRDPLEWLSLPVELVQHIYSFLSPLDVAHASCASRQFYLSSASSSTWSGFVRTLLPPVLEVLLPSCLAARKHWTCLKRVALYLQGTRQIYMETISILISLQSCLSQLDIGAQSPAINSLKSELEQNFAGLGLVLPSRRRRHGRARLIADLALIDICGATLGLIPQVDNSVLHFTVHVQLSVSEGFYSGAGPLLFGILFQNTYPEIELAEIIPIGRIWSPLQDAKTRLIRIAIPSNTSNPLRHVLLQIIKIFTDSAVLTSLDSFNM